MIVCCGNERFRASELTIFIELLSLNVEGKSVAISMPSISTACPSSPWDLTKFSEAIMAAAAPSLVGQHCSLVNGPYTGGDLIICSRVYSSRN